MPLVETRTLISLKNILFATDFSEYSQTALTVAANFARRHGAKLWVAHVVPGKPRLAIPIEAMPACFDAEWTAAERDMASLNEGPLLEGIPHELLLEHGALWPVLSKIVAQHDIGLMVVGTHGRGGVSKLLLGSVVVASIVSGSPLYLFQVCFGYHVRPSAPATTSMISWVISAWRARFICSV